MTVLRLQTKNIDIDETNDERLDGVQRGEHPSRRSGVATVIGWKKYGSVAGDVQHDRTACLAILAMPLKKPPS